MTLAIDGTSQTGVGTNGATQTMFLVTGLTTLVAGSIILTWFHAETPSGGVGAPVGTVSSPSLTWHKYGAIDLSGGLADNEASLWWAYSSGTLSAEIITVNFDRAYDDTSMVSFAVTGFTGTAYQTNPFDHAFTLTDSQKSTASSAPTATTTTTRADTMVLALVAGPNINDPGAVSVGFSFINRAINGANVLGSQSDLYENVYASTQVGLTATAANNVPEWIMFLPSLTQSAEIVSGNTPAMKRLIPYWDDWR